MAHRRRRQMVSSESGGHRACSWMHQKCLAQEPASLESSGRLSAAPILVAAAAAVLAQAAAIHSFIAYSSSRHSSQRANSGPNHGETSCKARQEVATLWAACD